VAYTQAQLDAIQAAIAKGERTVQFADRSVTYRSMDELLIAESRILSALSAGRSKQLLGVASKGLN
jgi:hypothetical protein